MTGLLGNSGGLVVLWAVLRLSPRSEEGSHTADGLFQCIFTLLAYRSGSRRSLNEKDLVPPQGSATLARRSRLANGDHLPLSACVTPLWLSC